VSNNVVIPTRTVVDLDRYRWQLEFFSKWIKHHIRIKLFYGTSENAVKTQIWIATSVYVLVAIIKKTQYSTQSLHNSKNLERDTL